MLLRHLGLLFGDALLLGRQPLLFADLALLGGDPLLLLDAFLFGCQALGLQTALALLLGLDLGEALPLGPFAAFLFFLLTTQLFQPRLERLLRLDQLVELLLVGLHRLLQLVAHLGTALLAGQQALVMLLLLAEQGLEAVLGLPGGLLVLGQLVTGGAQGFNGLDTGLVEVVEIVEGAAQLGRILLVEQQFEVIVVARLEGAFRLLGQQLFLMFCLLLQCQLVLLQGRQLLLVLPELLSGLLEFGGGSRNGLLVSLELGVELGKLLLAELEGLLLFLDLGLHGPQLLVRSLGCAGTADQAKKQRAGQQADATGFL